MEFLRRLGQFFLSTIEVFVLALAFFVIVYLVVFQPHQVKGNSMFSNFLDQELLLTEKISYRFQPPKRGDVIVFEAPERANCPIEGACDYIKRVIGLPGERIKIQAGRVYINDRVLPEEYLAEKDITRADNYLREGIEAIIAKDQYIAIGDNRNHSSDSRAWGPVERERIVGRAWITYWPISRIGLVPKINYPAGF